MKIIKTYIQWPTGNEEFEMEVSDEEWDSMTEAEREEYADDVASTAFYNRCNYGYEVTEGSDER